MPEDQGIVVVTDVAAAADVGEEEGDEECHTSSFEIRL